MIGSIHAFFHRDIHFDILKTVKCHSSKSEFRERKQGSEEMGDSNVAKSI